MKQFFNKTQLRPGNQRKILDLKKDKSLKKLHLFTVLRDDYFMFSAQCVPLLGLNGWKDDDDEMRLN
jgi:hypothetical protein